MCNENFDYLGADAPNPGQKVQQGTFEYNVLNVGYRGVRRESLRQIKHNLELTDEQWFSFLALLKEFDVGRAQKFEKIFNSVACYQRHDQIAFIHCLLGAGQHLDLILELGLRYENFTMTPEDYRARAASVQVINALGKQYEPGARKSLSLLQNELFHKTKALLDFKNASDPTLVKVVLHRLRKLFTMALDCQSYDESHFLLDSDNFSESVMLVVATARSLAGESPEALERMCKDLDVQIFQGGGLVGEINDGSSPKFLQSEVFGLPEWGMIQRHFEGSYQDYPDWKEVLRMNLAKDLNNPDAKFYLVYHQGKPVAIRKIVQKDNEHFFGGTFYVDEAYRGLGLVLEGWTSRDMPRNVVMHSLVAPNNLAVMRYLRSHRVMTGITTEKAGDLKSEPLFRMMNDPSLICVGKEFSTEEVVTKAQAGEKNGRIAFKQVSETDYLSVLQSYFEDGWVLSRAERSGSSWCLCFEKITKSYVDVFCSEEK